MNFKKQRPDSPFFFEKEQVISLLRLSTEKLQTLFNRRTGMAKAYRNVRFFVVNPVSGMNSEAISQVMPDLSAH